jgi:hypothetical protein
MRFTWRGREHRVDIPIAIGVALMVALAAAIAISRVVPLRPSAAAPAGSSHATTPNVAATPAQRPAPTPRVRTHAAEPARQGSRTRLTDLPFVGVANGTAGVAIRLTGDPAPDAPGPTLRPTAAGTWQDIGAYEVFRPASTLEPCTTYTLTIPAGTFALRHRTLGRTRLVSFNVACPGVTAVQETLARLGYLPYTLRGFVGASSLGPVTRAWAAQRAFEPPRNGVLLANVRDAPPLRQGVLDATTTGALEVFEAGHRLPLTTRLTRQLWTELIGAETLGHRDRRPYTWVTVSATAPARLQVHQGSAVVLDTPTSTGVPGATTRPGVFPICMRFASTTMVGRPQSNACVELPVPTPQQVYATLQLGDLVIVRAASAPGSASRIGNA